MANLGKNLQVLAHDAVNVAKKRKQIAKCLKANGFAFLGRGRWLGHRSRDIVSGFVTGGPVLDTYISTFVLPAFDKHEFVTWALGERIVHCSNDVSAEIECDQAVGCYRKNMSNIASSTDLIKYIDNHNISGHYPIWVNYISYLRIFDFESAVKYLDEDRRSRLHEVQLKQFDEIKQFASMHDRDGVGRVFERWSAISEKIFGPLDHPFDAL
jgi:hypothetical protein